MRFLHIIRVQNLGLMALVSWGLWSYLIPKYHISVVITAFEFILHLFAVLFIAAGGNIINDLYDIDTDKINKPEKVWIPDYISLKNARLLYGVLTGLGLIFGFAVSYLSEFYIYFVMYVTAVVLLFFYAKNWKKKLIFNNLIIAFLTAYPIIFVYAFSSDFFKMNANENQSSELTFQTVFIFLALFAFGLNWIREIVKDTEDTIGDKASGYKTLATEFELQHTKIIIYILTILLTLYLMFIAGKYWNTQTIFSLYLILAVGMSLFLFLQQISKTKRTIDFKKPSMLLKIIMLIGFFSVFLIEF
jgi:4-hydroxybenzoate polyprenyltransferase